MKLREILSLLRGVKGSGNKYTALCPVPRHGDKNPSLSVGVDGNNILLHCHKGCPKDEIIGALGLEMKDLFIEERSAPIKNNREIVAVYDYKDLDGEVVHQTVRFEPKDFRQRRPDPEKPGDYIWNLKGITPILYNFPAVVQAVKEKQPVFIVEGEKDCETLGSLGYIATTCPLGAGKWKVEYSNILKNASVYIIPDNDDVGKIHSENVAKSLLGKALTIKILDLAQIMPDIPEKGDITDFVKSMANTEETKEKINWLIEQTKEYRVTENLEAGRLVRMSDIEEREVDWLWKPYIPYRKITIFRGDPGLGKTYFVLTVASIVSNGWSFPDMANSGFTATTESNVLFLTAEDDLEDTIKPRLRLAKANMDKVFSFTDYITFSDPRFEGLLKKVSPRLVIIDPLQAFLGEGVDMHRANEIRPIFSYIRQLAEKYNFALIILEHLNKNIGGKAIYRGLGSMDITGAARSILMFGCDPEDDNIKGFMHAKSNLDRKGEIVGFSITSNGLEWNPHTTLTADMILGGGTSKTGRPSREVDEAVEFLKILLEGNLVTSDEVYEKAEAKGISRRTLERAKKEAGVDSVQKDRKWYWFIK